MAKPSWPVVVGEVFLSLHKGFNSEPIEWFHYEDSYGTDMGAFSAHRCAAFGGRNGRSSDR